MKVIGNHRPRGIDGDALLEYLKGRCIIDMDGCWLWQGAINDGGYGTIKYKAKTWRAHRLTAFLAGKGLPDEWDHICEKKNCINPTCLDNITHIENVRRGKLNKVSAKRYENTTTCPSGHPYLGHNLYVDPKGHRRCRECDRLSKQLKRGIK